MSEDSVVRFRRPGEIEDPLTELLRAGARRLIEQAVAAGGRCPARRVCRFENAGRPPAACAPWPRPRVGGLDRDRSRADPPSQGWGSGSGRGWRAHPVHLRAIAPVRAADAVGGRRAANPLPARRLQWRLPGGLVRSAGTGRARALRPGGGPPQGRMGGRA